ncbi:MAG: HAMP domain-containing histidine kinase [Sphingomonadales bacterium]|nr:HAMP domain-containing histidine kinase [Sphingomonadales bacterium]MBD3772222.1 HAMP domain-containing histidine kinase [Paracoccaceae bacterium]
MALVTTAYIAQGKTDGQDRLVEADELLSGLQRRCGGDMPGVIAIPELLELVRKSRAYGLRLARKIRAFDGDELISAWVEIEPTAGEGEGCEIGVANWQASPMAAEGETRAAERVLEIDRTLAELSARLDARQNVLAVECSAPDLAELAQAMRDGAGRPWTSFLDLPGSSHAQPLHWRLLDGSRCHIPGSDREWRAVLVPHGQPEPGSAGFDLHLIADTPLPRVAPKPEAEATAEKRLATPSLGRDLSPVLRKPIARIIANAETIRARLAGPLADEYSAYAADIASAGQHLLALIDDLSDLEVVEAEGFTTAPDRIDLADVARRATGILGVRAQEKRVVLVAPQTGESLPAIGEFRRVLQVLLNLIGNAINYSPEGSQVWLRLESAADRARITVADQGQGLSEAQQAKVFEKFERLGRSGDGGSGLGLYISRRLARAMGGELTVESAPGQGARFTLELPSAPAE